MRCCWWLVAGGAVRGEQNGWQWDFVVFFVQFAICGAVCILGLWFNDAPVLRIYERLKQQHPGGKAVATYSTFVPNQDDRVTTSPIPLPPRPLLQALSSLSRPSPAHHSPCCCCCWLLVVVAPVRGETSFREATPRAPRTAPTSFPSCTPPHPTPPIPPTTSTHPIPCSRVFRWCLGRPCGVANRAWCTLVRSGGSTRSSSSGTSTRW
jgi:hypothetical protein